MILWCRQWQRLRSQSSTVWCHGRGIYWTTCIYEIRMWHPVQPLPRLLREKPQTFSAKRVWSISHAQVPQLQYRCACMRNWPINLLVNTCSKFGLWYHCHKNSWPCGQRDYIVTNKFKHDCVVVCNSLGLYLHEYMHIYSNCFVQLL